MKIKFSSLNLKNNDNVILPIDESLSLSKIGKEVDKILGGNIVKLIKSRSFKATEGEVLEITNFNNVVNTVLLVGIGKEKKINKLVAKNFGGKIYNILNKLKIKNANILVDNFKKNENIASNIAYGLLLRSYEFTKYKTKDKNKDKNIIKEINISLPEYKEAENNFNQYLTHVANGVFLSRDLVTEPPNILHPESYADIVKSELTKLGATVKILNERQMKKLNMGALLGVGQGSEKESRLVIIKYNGNKNSKNTDIGFVGKGVTFDTGGISLKPSAGMEEMKYDMGGSAAVVGTMAALAARNANVNAVGIIGLVENMPSHMAQRPSDVVKSMSGQTIEVLNTDAEGRLVLCDALTYCQQEFKPEYVVNLATLTGAIVIALGEEHAGLFSNSDELSNMLLKSGLEVDEKLWRFPLNKEYDKLLDSPIADMQNISSGRGAGSITAAQFLQRFIEKGTKWAHLDIAGMAWTKKDKDICPKGAVGFGVRLLDNLVNENFE